VKIYIEYSFQKGAWGGGNQFLKALKNQLFEKGLYCDQAKYSDIILFNAHQNAGNVVKLKNKFPEKIFAHRMDGIYKLYNKPNDSRQDLCFDLNSKIADCTIFQTAWAKKEHIKFGLNTDKPNTIICNAPNQKIFNTDYKKNNSEKVKLVCTSWSINKNKGFGFYKFLDDNLDFNKYTFTYIGNDPGIKFNNIKKVGPLNSIDLAKKIQAHDIFLTASKYECCSNSLLEAMSCGLPAVGLNSGGTPDLIKSGGELFNSEDDIISSIDKVSSNIESYSSKINIKNISIICDEYISFFNKLKI